MFVLEVRTVPAERAKKSSIVNNEQPLFVEEAGCISLTIYTKIGYNLGSSRCLFTQRKIDQVLGFSSILKGSRQSSSGP